MLKPLTPKSSPLLKEIIGPKTTMLHVTVYYFKTIHIKRLFSRELLERASLFMPWNYARNYQPIQEKLPCSPSSKLLKI